MTAPPDAAPRRRPPAFPPELAERLRELGATGRLDVLRALAEPPPDGTPLDDGAVAGLLDAGLLREVPPPREGRADGTGARHVRPDVPALFALAETVRALAEAAARAEASRPVGIAAPAEPTGPRLVLVHGVPLGRAYALDALDAPGAAEAGEAGARVVVIGRSDEAGVRLDGDPFVSARHSALVATPAERLLIDLGSRNGTTLNWARLPPDHAVVVRPGDVIGVGRTILLYRE